MYPILQFVSKKVCLYNKKVFKMKKILSFFMASLMIMSFASCNKNGGNEPDDPSGKVDPSDPSAQTDPASFAITVSDITASTAHIKVVPSSNTVTYFWNIVSKDELKENKMTLEEWAADDMVYYPEEGYTFDDLASKGVEEFDISPLQPETEYYAYAYQFDKDFNIIGDIASSEFKTAKFEIIGSETLNLSDADYTWEYDASSKDGYLSLYGFDATKNLELGLLFLVNGNNPNGTFTEADMDEPYADYGYYFNYLHDGAKDAEYQLVSANVTGAFNADKSLYIFSGEAVALNGIKYSFKDVQAVEYEYPEDDDDDSWLAPARVRDQKKNIHVQRGAKKLFTK